MSAGLKNSVAVVVKVGDYGCLSHPALFQGYAINFKWLILDAGLSLDFLWTFSGVSVDFLKTFIGFSEDFLGTFRGLAI